MQKLEESKAVQAAAPPVTLPVSVIVPVRNEAGNLPRCLESLRGVGEIYVIDSQSSDGTVEIARVLRRSSGPVPLRRGVAQETPVGNGHSAPRL